MRNFSSCPGFILGLVRLILGLHGFSQQFQAEWLLDTHGAPAIRFFLLRGHYRRPIDFEPTNLAAARRGLVRLLKQLDPPDLFLHNHARNAPLEFDPNLPVNPRCVTCLDAEMWVGYVARVAASFETMLREAGIGLHEPAPMR